MEMEKFYVAPEVEKVLCSSGSGSSGGGSGKRIRWKSSAWGG